MALISKFATMVSKTRRLEKKYLDAGDFGSVFFHNRDEVDLEKLRRIAGEVCPGGGARVMRLIDDLSAGRWVQF